MSMEIPCITTPLTNLALGAINNENILIAKTAQEFADRIEFLLKNPILATEIGKKGRIFVQEHFNWNKSSLKLEKIIQSG